MRVEQSGDTDVTAILDVSHSPRTIEGTSKRGKNAQHLEQGLLEAAVEEDDDGRAGASSSDKTLPQGLPNGQSRAATVDSVPTCLVQDSTGTGVEQSKAPPDAPTGRRVPAGHAARSQTQRRQVRQSREWSDVTSRPSGRLQSFGVMDTRKPKRTTKHDRSLTLALARSGP